MLIFLIFSSQGFPDFSLPFAEFTHNLQSYIFLSVLLDSSFPHFPHPIKLRYWFYLQIYSESVYFLSARPLGLTSTLPSSLTRTTKAASKMVLLLLFLTLYNPQSMHQSKRSYKPKLYHTIHIIKTPQWFLIAIKSKENSCSSNVPLILTRPFHQLLLLQGVLFHIICLSVSPSFLADLRINTSLHLFINAFYGHPMYSSHSDTLLFKEVAESVLTFELHRFELHRSTYNADCFQ